MPLAFSTYYMQSVVIKGTLYVGGGSADGNNSYIVMAYNISAGKWATLPPYNTFWFAMTAIDDQLVLVGGKGCNDKYSKVLGALRTDSKQWTHPYPDMTTARYVCSAVSYKHWVVVAGGHGAFDGRLSSVEVMNIETKQWYAGPPTPIAWSQMKTAVVGDTCYFMGGVLDEGTNWTKKVYSVSLPALVSQLNSDSSAKDTQMWKELPLLPIELAAPLSIGGSLLAVGGRDNVIDYKEVAALHLYQPDAGQWVKVADMPTPRRACTCSKITDEELLVAAGYHQTRVDIAQIY